MRIAPYSGAVTVRTVPSLPDHTEHTASKPTIGLKYSNNSCSKSTRERAESAISETTPESRSAFDIVIAFHEYQSRSGLTSIRTTQIFNVLTTLPTRDAKTARVLPRRPSCGVSPWLTGSAFEASPLPSRARSHRRLLPRGA